MRAAAFLGFLLLTLSLGTTPALAAKSCVKHDWGKIATLTVDFSRNAETVDASVPNAFDALAFEVEGNPMVIRDVSVIGGNAIRFFAGADLIFSGKIWRRDVLVAQGLDGIAHVAFSYRPFAGQKPATITIWGRQTRGLTGPGC